MWSLGLLIGGLIAACWCGLSGCLALADAERLSTACVAVVMPLGGLAATGYGYHLRTSLPKLRHRAKRMRRLADEAEPGGAAGLPPVEMGDWYGSVWTFTFANGQYARWLSDVNRSKLVS